MEKKNKRKLVLPPGISALSCLSSGMLTRRKDVEGPLKVQLPAQGTAIFNAWSGC